MSSRPVAKKPPQDYSPTSKTLTTAYSGWVSDAIFCADCDTVRLFLSLSGWDGTSLELTTQIYVSATDTWHTELRITGGTAAIDDASIADTGILADEGDAVAVPLDVRGHERVRVRAKRTGGSAGDLTLYASAG